jgi:hypothetical protein
MILGIWIRIRWCVNTLANSSGISKRMPGRNAIGGSIIIIERLHPSCQTVSGRWNHFSWPSFAVAMRVYFVTHCMKFTLRGFSGEMPPSLLRSSELEEHCFQC